MDIDPNIIKQGFDYLPKTTIESLFNPTADAIGRGIGGIFYWIFQKPIRLGIIKKEEFADLANKTAQNLEQIPLDNRTDEKKGLMIKAIENSQYSLDSDTLRECFAKLIANTADSSLTSQISPSFAMILGNISSREAKFLQLFKKNNDILPRLPIANINLKVSKIEKETKEQPFGTYQIIYPGIVLTHSQFGINISNYDSEIDLLESFGLVNKKYGEFSPGYNDDYQLIEKAKITTALKNEVTNLNSPFDKLYLEKGEIKPTALGKSFINCVLP